MRAVVFVVFLLAGACGGSSGGDLVGITDREEIVSHRSFEWAPIRRVRACTPLQGNYWATSFYDRVPFTLVVDRSGRVDANGVREQVPEECAREIEQVVRSWRYVPFERDGRAVRAEIVEHIVVIPVERWRDQARPFPPVRADSVIQITLYRSMDYYVPTNCPIHRYRVALSGDGAFVVQSLRTTPSGEDVELGRGRVSADEVNRLVTSFARANFFSLQDEYHSGFTHQAGSITSINIDGREATVAEALGEAAGMPRSVRDLADEIDRTLGVAQWVGEPRCYRPALVEEQAF
jgi:hypothetical protein